VGVFGALVTPRVNTWIDGELYFPKRWFEENFAKRRKKIGMPEDLSFKKKPELAWEIIQRARESKVPFEAVDMDDLYGRNMVLRRRLDQNQIEYYGDVPKDTYVYLKKPKISYPMTKRGKRSKRYQISTEHRYQVQQLGNHPAMEWATLTLRPNERGQLHSDFGRCRVWTVHQGQCYQEWLLIRQDQLGLHAGRIEPQRLIAQPAQGPGEIRTIQRDLAHQLPARK